MILERDQMPKNITNVTLCRIRLTQRILLAVSEQNPELLTDPHWQHAMVHVAQLLAKADEVNPARTLAKFDHLDQALEGVEESAAA